MKKCPFHKDYFTEERPVNEKYNQSYDCGTIAKTPRGLKKHLMGQRKYKGHVLSEESSNELIGLVFNAETEKSAPVVKERLKTEAENSTQQGNFSYFGNKYWKDITRDERYFCAELYFCTRNDISRFINFLNDNIKYAVKYDPNLDWEVGLEVCFYRDLHHFNPSLYSDDKKSGYSPKRTFDICLFSPQNIIIIEAKAQQMLSGKQVQSFQSDLKNVSTYIGNQNVKVDLVVLGQERIKNSSLLPLINPAAVLTWKQLSEFYSNNAILRRAEDIN